ncbi:MAG: hypothetical protein WBK37_10270, partial [Kiritimatiellia bacterium]
RLHGPGRYRRCGCCRAWCNGWHRVLHRGRRVPHDGFLALWARRRNARRLLGDSHPRHQGEQQASACQAPSGLDNKTGLKRILHVAGNLTAAPKLRQVQSELSARARAR